ncbi:glycosyltransferase family 4 protein [Alistipes sp.]|uniref:glycosyltransferase family 4 protein n=1 Tax=Alistipes sp. TaxID=1872444 RepID=UPI003077B7D7
MLNVLINAYAVSPNWGSEPGMGWNWVVNLAKYCNLYIITEGEWKDDIEAVVKTLPQKDHLHFYYNPLPDRIRKMCWNQGDWRFYWYYRKWQKRTFEIAQSIIGEHHIDVIHQLNMIGFREPGFLWKIKDIPFVWGPVGGMELMPTGYLAGTGLVQKLKVYLKNFLNNLQRKYQPRLLSVLNRADAVIAATKGVYDLIANYHHKKVILINETGCYVNQNQVNESADSFDVLWVGKFDFRKQLGLALHVIANMPKDCLVKLHVAGSGQALEVNRYKELAKDLGIENRVEWHGLMPHDKVLALMSKCDLFLFTSIMEGTPHVVLEALQNNLPIVCLDTCGQAGVVDDTIGFKIPVTNTNQSIRDFTDTIINLYNHRDLLTKLKSNCLERQKQLSWDNKARQMVEIYEDTLRAKR